MATAGYATRIGITTTDTAPSASDLAAPVMSTGLNRTAAELDTSYLGTAYTAFILGKRGAEVPYEADWDSSDTAQTRIIAAFNDGSSIWVHVLYTGTAGDKVECKVSGITIGTPQDGKVSFSATIKSVGAVASTTLSA